MYIIIAILIITIFINIHVLLKNLRRRQLKDKILEDEQALIEYERFKMEQEIKKLQEENKKLKKSRN